MNTIEALSTVMMAASAAVLAYVSWRLWVIKDDAEKVVTDMMRRTPPAELSTPFLDLLDRMEAKGKVKVVKHIIRKEKEEEDGDLRNELVSHFEYIDSLPFKVEGIVRASGNLRGLGYDAILHRLNVATRERCATDHRDDQCSSYYESMVDAHRVFTEMKAEVKEGKFFARVVEEDSDYVRFSDGTEIEVVDI